MPDPYLYIEHKVDWSNRHRNVTGKVASYYDVWNLWADQSHDPVPWRPGLAGLQRAIRDAEAAGVSVRAFGGAWSLSHAAYCSQFMLNTAPLNARNIGIEAANLVHGSISGDRLMFAQSANNTEGGPDPLAAKS